jgi:hypothetical protein
MILARPFDELVRHAIGALAACAWQGMRSGEATTNDPCTACGTSVVAMPFNDHNLSLD